MVLNEKNEVETVFVVYDTYEDKVRMNSLLELVTSPIGLGSQLLFHPGKSETKAAERSFIPSFDTVEGKKLVEQALVDRPPKDDTITRLLSNVNPLVENINMTVIQLEKSLQLVNATLAGTGGGPVASALDSASKAVAGVNDLVAGVNAAVGTTGPRVDNIVAGIEDSLPRLLERAEQSAKSVKETADSIATIGENLRQTSEAFKDPTGLVPRLLDPQGSLKTFLNDGDRLFDKVDGSLAQIEGALGNLEGTTSVLSDQMPRIAATIEEARSAIVKAQDVLEGLKNNPLLRGGIPERVEPQAAPTSLRTTDF
ncbi:MAG: hypothetical protein A2Y36_04015 [Treponema sp. GWA1_62_8]|nr:MAG: hypothetical protein A2Y36_04015 [Treponema sp. GWA1_62_8]